MISQEIKSEIRLPDRCFNIFRMFLLSGMIISVASCTGSHPENKSTVQKESFSPVAGSSSDTVSVSNRYNRNVSPQGKHTFPYDLENPDEIYILPGKLVEISGLAYINDERILSIQDEKGAVFVLDMVNRGKISKYDFGKDGDYEDVSVAGTTVWVLKSDGRLFGIKDFDNESIKVKRYKTPLSKINNTEGLAYDSSSNSLLIACKGSPSVDDDKPYIGYRAVYRFDLGEMKLIKKPEFLIDVNNPDCYRDAALLSRFSLMHPGKLLPGSGIAFNPSAIAIHPLTDRIWLISSIGKILVIIDRQGKILDLQDLDPAIFVQPEGLCFSPSGDMYISSEGKEGKGYVLKFNLQNSK